MVVLGSHSELPIVFETLDPWKSLILVAVVVKGCLKTKTSKNLGNYIVGKGCEVDVSTEQLNGKALDLEGQVKPGQATGL
jgi:hypothetical protein